MQLYIKILPEITKETIASAESAALRYIKNWNQNAKGYFADELPFALSNGPHRMKVVGGESTDIIFQYDVKNAKGARMGHVKITTYEGDSTPTTEWKSAV